MEADFVTYITQYYCEKTSCNVRECEVTTKDQGLNPEPEICRCPACGSRLKVHWRRNLGEHQQKELENAIGRVNVALYGRDHPDELGHPMSVLMLEELPDSWNYVEHIGK